MSLPEGFLVEELLYKDVRNYLATFLDQCDLYMLECAISRLFHDNSRGQLALEDAVRNGNGRMVKLLHVSYGFSLTHCLLWYASQYGHVKMIRWLMKHDCPRPRGYILAARNAGHTIAVNLIKSFDYAEREVLAHALRCTNDCFDMDEIQNMAVKRPRLE